jgi:PKD repeat protein
MKKQLFTILSTALLSFSSIAQQRDANLIPCATYDAMEEAFKNNPNLRTKYTLIQSELDLEYKAEMNKAKNKMVAAPVYTIPVVFHIMGPQNVSDLTFENLISYINNDYAKTGSDIATISSLYSSLYVDSEIRFALAKKDPNGKCTNGIIRHDNENIYWSQTSPAYNYSGTGTNRWPTNKYLNVYVVECISSATSTCPVTSGSYIGGYTYLPGSAPGTNADAIVILKSQLAQNDPRDSRTLGHEMGHWLNLSHTFGSTNNPGVSCGDDGVSDTPPTKGYFSTCPSSAGGNTCDASTNANVENIMDYSSCPKMFTQGQVTRMRSALTSATAGRNNLWTPANLLATGITSGYTCTPVADFEANKLANCAGSTITYTSTSEFGSSGGVSWTFEGGTPATSTATSVVVSYPTPGTYSVSLTATNTAGTNTMNKTSYINVINGAGGVLAPTMYDFDAASLPSNISIINNNVGSVAWAQKTTNGANATAKSIHLNNAATTNIAGHIDIFETPIYDFSSTTGISMSFYYAYAKKVATQIDTFRIQYSLDCGGTWSALLASPSTAVMAAASGGTLSTAFNPTSTQWIFKSIPSSVTTALNNKPSVKFRFYFRVDPTKTTANNMYLDQINITGNVVTGITELEKTMALAIYPNPTSSTSTLDFTINANEKAKVTLVDMMGRVLEEASVIADNDGRVNHTINTTGHVASGVYIVNIDVNNQRVSKKLIVQ